MVCLLMTPCSVRVSSTSSSCAHHSKQRQFGALMHSADGMVKGTYIVHRNADQKLRFPVVYGRTERVGVLLKIVWLKAAKVVASVSARFDPTQRISGLHRK